ncbi:UDP-N-acetylmuramoyl-L-alanine--D-glutamate ligase [Sciscionella sediminilitoris]|uniref:UDP-N-acetylmuramoyl-L-alanine--D-glutamate ligase n=1 Tax=Sciscionella sediminilitoris TaxID=1445613 RepID=UPI0004DF5B97|nr:UDP-N-acetylmuramoyl-L-alanine--D-glutamate ligase [Sciscionella sp. SE31]
MAQRRVTALAGRKVLVTGAGVTGRSVVTALIEAGAEVTVTDANAERLREFSVHTEAGLTEPPEGTELVVTSPGWRPDAPVLAAAAARGIEVISEVELAWRAAPDTVTWLGVTGTNGKTTTVGMLESMLRAAGLDAVACGNVGLPVIEAVRDGHQVLAVELSSFQLHWSNTLRMTAATVLNVAEDHLDWHGGLEAYAEAKGSIYRGEPLAVYNARDEWSARLAGRAANRMPFTAGEAEHGYRLSGTALLAPDGTELAPIAEVNPPGPHNLANALAAAALAQAAGADARAVREGLRAYRPDAHRAVTVAERDGIRYVDDSKATNPHAAAASLGAYENVVWIAGGLLKGASVDELVERAASRLRAAVLIGTDAGQIEAALARHAPEVPVVKGFSGHDNPMRTMSEIVTAARSLAKPGDTVLLAPAAASMDMFTDYKQRGEAFAAAVTR